MASTPSPPPPPTTSHESPFRMDITPVRTNQVNLFFSPAQEDDEPTAGQVPQVYTRSARRTVQDDDDDEDEDEGRVPSPPSKRQRTATAPSTAAARLAASRRQPADPGQARTSALSLFDDDGLDFTSQADNLETFDPLKGPVGMMNGSGGGEDDDDATVKRKRPIPKLNAERLLSDRGFPALVKDAKRFRIRGKGHEAKDLANLLSTYQMWAHQLFPKMPFSETVARVELLCNTKLAKSALKGYRERDRELREALFRSPTPPAPTIPPDQPPNPNPDPAASARPASNTADQGPPTDDDEEDYEAIIAAAEAEAAANGPPPPPPSRGHGEPDEEEDYEAMIAAAEAEAAEAHARDIVPRKEGGGSVRAADEFEDDWAAMDGL